MLEHYKKTDYDFIIKAKDWIKQVNYRQTIRLTNFLNPNEQKIIEALLNKEPEVSILFEGGFTNSERKRAIIFPAYMDVDDFEFKISGFKIQFSSKEQIPEHRQILGSLMALKINRALIGDIVFLPNDEIFFAICEEFSLFIEENFTMLNHYPITLIETNIQSIEKNNDFEAFDIIISSLRLDVLVATLINASRSKANDYIKQGFIQKNHSIEKNVSHVCQIGDIISVKGFGRFKIIKQKKTTKNNKLVITMGKAI